MFSPSVENLVAQLTRLPGIGSRTAQRLAFHLLQTQKEEALALAAAINDVKERVRFCRECGNLTEDELCAICLDARRDRTLICVVEQPVDLVSLERTAEYRGLYHVLGGALSPLDGVEPEHLRIDELMSRVQSDGVREVVLATNPNATGEATASYLAGRLRDRVRVTRLASGASPRTKGREAGSAGAPPTLFAVTATHHEPVPEVAADAETASHDLVVMKFGGTSVGDTDKIKEVARRLVHAREQGQRVVGV